MAGESGIVTPRLENEMNLGTETQARAAIHYCCFSGFYLSRGIGEALLPPHNLLDKHKREVHALHDA